MFFGGNFSFTNFLMDALTLFALVVWFWLLITIMTDLFRRDNVSGWGKALWVVLVLIAPLFGVLAYMIFQGRGMGLRHAAQVRHRDEARSMMGFSVADEIEKLDRLRQSGSITDSE